MSAAIGEAVEAVDTYPSLVFQRGFFCFGEAGARGRPLPPRPPGGGGWGTIPVWPASFEFQLV